MTSGAAEIDALFRWLFGLLAVLAGAGLGVAAFLDAGGAERIRPETSGRVLELNQGLGIFLIFCGCVLLAGTLLTLATGRARWSITGAGAAIAAAGALAYVPAGQTSVGSMLVGESILGMGGEAAAVGGIAAAAGALAAAFVAALSVDRLEAFGGEQPAAAGDNSPASPTARPRR